MSLSWTSIRTYIIAELRIGECIHTYIHKYTYYIRHVHIYVHNEHTYIIYMHAYIHTYAYLCLPPFFLSCSIVYVSHQLRYGGFVARYDVSHGGRLHEDDAAVLSRFRGSILQWQCCCQRYVCMYACIQMRKDENVMYVFMYGNRPCLLIFKFHVRMYIWINKWII